MWVKLQKCNHSGIFEIVCKSIQCLWIGTLPCKVNFAICILQRKLDVKGSFKLSSFSSSLLFLWSQTLVGFLYLIWLPLIPCDDNHNYVLRHFLYLLYCCFFPSFSNKKKHIFGLKGFDRKASFFIWYSLCGPLVNLEVLTKLWENMLVI